MSTFIPGKVCEVQISDIICENRIREDLGDLEELKHSLSTTGLLHPITVSSQMRLVAGERRLTAAKSLGWTTIEVRILDTSSKDELLLIELLENMARKDFTWAEICENVKAIHEHLTQVAKQEGRTWSVAMTATKLNYSRTQVAYHLELAKILRTMPELRKLDTAFAAKREYNERIKIIEARSAAENLSQKDQEALDKLLALAQTARSNPAGSTPSKPGGRGVSDRTPTNSPSGETVRDITDSPEAPVSAPAIPVASAAYHIGMWEDILPTIPEGIIGFSEIDPPYAIALNDTLAKASTGDTDMRTFTDWDVKQYKQSIPALLEMLYGRLMDNAWVLFWAPFDHIEFTQKVAKKLKYKVQLPGVWSKPGAAANSPSTNMVRNMETFLLFRKGNATFNTNSFLACFSHNVPSSKERIHVTEKPVSLYTTFLNAMGKHGHVAFCPFAGSGNFLLAAATYGMDAIGCDLSETYRDHFLARYSKLMAGGAA